MKAIIGLGNPEIKYKNTRHNTGFLIVDEILKAHQVTLINKFNSFFAKKDNLMYLLPKTYMNLSGNAILEIINFYKLTNNDILVIYDDATIEFGTFRLKKSGSFGGHNGIKSIISCLGTDVFDRLKVGVGPVPNNISIDSFVLSNFNDNELKNIELMGKHAVKLIDCWLNEGMEAAQNKFNKKMI